jgi:hypothetical protein
VFWVLGWLAFGRQAPNWHSGSVYYNSKQFSNGYCVLYIYLTCDADGHITVRLPTRQIPIVPTTFVRVTSPYPKGDDHCILLNRAYANRYDLPFVERLNCNLTYSTFTNERAAM